MIMFIIIVCGLFAAGEFAGYVVYGKYVKIPIRGKTDISKLRLNMFDENIIDGLVDGRYVSYGWLPISLSRYHIAGVGRVFIFSEAHRRIKRIHRELKKEKVKTIKYNL